ncbi:unnamed protein product [Acanthoscelides obtectus]|uniref:Uncharacterized protein n=1 Tax=Acanthoscelides obtectus TaxID=200917 RepID=A0A9P0PKI2_ACAOB|nr:unnamed protein product [Acanthoscelides obtectus]CAK1641512.1 hypothetical protein AOBTE_LOCUS12453 [Acanthoscelides obtectus]
MNNKPGFVIAQRGSKHVSAVTSAEKGETISVITSCNAEGSFIPPTCIFKELQELCLSIRLRFHITLILLTNLRELHLMNLNLNFYRMVKYLLTIEMNLLRIHLLLKYSNR